MALNGHPFALAISRMTEGESSREPQNLRAIKWLLEQQGGTVVVVTPRKDFESPTLKNFVAHPQLKHETWRGFSAGVLRNSRVLYVWPDRERLYLLWRCGADAVAVIEWNESETDECLDGANTVQLFSDRTVEPATVALKSVGELLPNGVDGILEYVAKMAAGYSTGLKWNEEDMLKADMMNRPERWAPITVEQVRAKCRALGMRPKDGDTVTGFLQRRKDGRRFNVRSSYRDFQFN